VIANVVAASKNIVIYVPNCTGQALYDPVANRSAPLSSCNLLSRDTPNNCVDIVGVTGSIPVTPTIQAPEFAKKITRDSCRTNTRQGAFW
jgi:hypothetical protein